MQTWVTLAQAQHNLGLHKPFRLHWLDATTWAAVAGLHELDSTSWTDLH